MRHPAHYLDPVKRMNGYNNLMAMADEYLSLSRSETIDSRKRMFELQSRSYREEAMNYVTEVVNT